MHLPGALSSLCAGGAEVRFRVLGEPRLNLRPSGRTMECMNSRPRHARVPKPLKLGQSLSDALDITPLITAAIRTKGGGLAAVGPYACLGLWTITATATIPPLIGELANFLGRLAGLPPLIASPEPLLPLGALAAACAVAAHLIGQIGPRRAGRPNT